MHVYVYSKTWTVNYTTNKATGGQHKIILPHIHVLRLSLSTERDATVHLTWITVLQLLSTGYISNLQRKSNSARLKQHNGNSVFKATSIMHYSLPHVTVWYHCCNDWKFTADCGLSLLVLCCLFTCCILQQLSVTFVGWQLNISHDRATHKTVLDRKLSNSTNISVLNNENFKKY